MFTALLAVIFLLFLFAAAFFILAVFPVWMLIECIQSRLQSNAMKVLWIASIIMAWPLGSIAYASFASQKRLLARIANLIMVALIVASLLFSIGIYYFRSVLLPATVAQYQKIDFEGVSKEDQNLIRADLGALQKQMQANSFFSSKSLVALELFELFQSIVLRPKVSPSDLKDWIRQVSLRESTREESLGAYMNSIREKTIRNVFKRV